MAIFSIADMSSAMSVVFREVVAQTQRKAPTLRLLAAIGQLKRGNTGRNMTWDARFSGQIADAVNLDAGNFLTAASDARVPATLAYGSYEAPVKVSDDLVWSGEPTAGLPPDINPFADSVGQNMKEAVEALVKKLNVDIFSGTGSSNRMTGLSSAVAATGTYANIAQSSQSQWASTAVANSGTLRSLSLALIKQTCRTIAAASAAGRPDIAITTPALMDVLEGLFDSSFTRVTYQQSAGSTQPSPNMERVTMNPPVITTAGGKINADGFRVLKWENQGLYFVEDPDCTDTAQTNANNVMYLLNSGELDMLYLPPPGRNLYETSAEAIAAAEQQLGPLAGLQFELTKRGRTTHATEWDCTTKVGVRLRSRNAHGLLADIQ